MGVVSKSTVKGFTDFNEISTFTVLETPGLPVTPGTPSVFWHFT